MVRVVRSIVRRFLQGAVTHSCSRQLRWTEHSRVSEYSARCLGGLSLPSTRQLCPRRAYVAICASSQGAFSVSPAQVLEALGRSVSFLQRDCRLAVKVGSRGYNAFFISP